MPELVIELEKDTIRLWRNNKEDKYNALEREIKRSSELINFVQQYQRDRWQVESVGWAEIDEIEDNIGYVRIEFGIKKYEGCKDLDEVDDQQLTFNFKINYNNQSITLQGDEIRERTTMDEF